MIRSAAALATNLAHGRRPSHSLPRVCHQNGVGRRTRRAALHVLKKWETGRLRVGAEKLLEAPKFSALMTTHSGEWSGAISHEPLPGQVVEAPSCAETERL